MQLTVQPPELDEVPVTEPTALARPFRLGVRARDGEQATLANLSLEFVSAATFAAVACSIATARKQKRKLKITGDPLAYLPKEPALFNAVALQRPRLRFDHILIGKLAMYYRHMALALELSPKDSATWQDDDGQGADWSQLLGVWQPLCRQARTLLQYMSEIDCLRGTEQIAQMLELDTVMRAATNGGSPCIRSDGAVFIPGWFDRRRDRRIALGISAILETSRVRQRVVLSDISCTGAGVAAAPFLQKGSPLRLELPHGHRLSGAVAWSHGGKIGMHFTPALALNDPLFGQLLVLRRTARPED